MRNSTASRERTVQLSRTDVTVQLRESVLYSYQACHRSIVSLFQWCISSEFATMVYSFGRAYSQYRVHDLESDSIASGERTIESLVQLEVR